MKNRFCFMIFLVLIFSNQSKSQEQSGGFVIITFEENYKWTQHGTKSFYWVIPNDSLDSNGAIFSRLFLDGFSVNNIEDCCKGEQIDPFLTFDNSIYDFDEHYLESLTKLRSIISEKRRKMQSIRKKWPNGQSAKINVYVTPIIGSFCSSQYHILGQKRDGYKGIIYLPVLSDFREDDSFWKGSKAEHLLYKDFSKMDYDVIR